MKINILHASLFTPIAKNRWGLAMLAWSAPGEGKTSVIEAMAEGYGLPCETLSPGERGEGAFGVVPVPEGGKLTYPAPDWVEKFADGGIVFVDEMTTAPPALQAPLLGLLLARRIGSFTFGPRVRVLGAANPPELAAGGFDLASSVANRVGHLEWGAPTVEEHTAYMLSGGTGNGGMKVVEREAKDEESRVLKVWPDAFAKARGLETAFLARRPGLKNVCPKAGDPAASRGWPSDRSWENATRALASSEVHDLTEAEMEEFVAAFIGEAAASELFAFRQEQDLPDPSRILDGVETFTHTSARLDRTAAVLNACTSLVTPGNAAKRQPRSAALWGLLEKLTESKADLDIIIPAVHALIEANLHAMKDAAKTLAKVQPVLKAAGIKPAARR